MTQYPFSRLNFDIRSCYQSPVLFEQAETLVTHRIWDTQVRSPGKLTGRGNKRMETGRKGTGCYCGKLRTVVFLGLKLVVSAAHDTAHKINNQEKKGQSQNTLRDVDKEQGKRNKRVKTSLKQRGVRVIVAYLLGNLSDRFLQNKSKRKKKKNVYM